MTLYRVTTAHADRRREFADEPAALAYIRLLFRSDARLAAVTVVRVEEHPTVYRRDDLPKTPAPAHGEREETPS